MLSYYSAAYSDQDKMPRYDTTFAYSQVTVQETRSKSLFSSSWLTTQKNVLRINRFTAIC